MNHNSLVYNMRFPLAESLLEVLLKAETYTVFDPNTGDELSWPENLLGPMPNTIKIKDNEIKFIKTTGRKNSDLAAAPSSTKNNDHLGRDEE